MRERVLELYCYQFGVILDSNGWEAYPPLERLGLSADGIMSIFAFHWVDMFWGSLHLPMAELSLVGHMWRQTHTHIHTHTYKHTHTCVHPNEY